MILTPTPLQRPARPAGTPVPRPATPARVTAPVLHSLRAPRQLCLDLQPRLR